MVIVMTDRKDGGRKDGVEECRRKEERKEGRLLASSVRQASRLKQHHPKHPTQRTKSNTGRVARRIPADSSVNSAHVRSYVCPTCVWCTCRFHFGNAPGASVSKEM